VSETVPHDEIESLLGVYAVDAVDATERALIERHLESCPRCRAEVDEHRSALAVLVEDETAPPALWEHISAAITPSATTAPPTGALATVIPFPRRRWLLSTAAAAAVAAGIAVGLTLAFTSDGLGDPDLRAAVLPIEAATVVDGSAALYDTQSSQGVLVLDLENLPAAPAGHHYEVWVLRASAGGEMEAVGAFSQREGSTRLELPLPGPGDYAAVDISVEEDGGSAEHSGVSIAGATFS
jgi:anti-sigma-K factor RskA